MPDIAEIYTKLQAADAAGDTAGAKVLAEYIRSEQGKTKQKGQEGAKPAATAMQPPAPAPAQKPEGHGLETKTLGSTASAIGASTATGAVLGAFTPEILKSLSVAAATGGALFPPAAPVLEPIAAGLALAGYATQAARASAVVAGAVSGLMSESAGQTAEALGAGSTTSTITRIAAGFASPGAIASMVAKPAKAAWSLATKLLQGAESVPAAVKTAREGLSSLTATGKPELTLHAGLLKGVEADRAAAESAANATVAHAHERAATIAKTDQDAAQRVIDDARTHASQLRAEARTRAEVLKTATNGKLETAARVKATADKELASIAPPAHISDIGNTLRSAVTTEQQALLAKRGLEYQRLVEQRNANVALKESSGIHMDSIPEMKALKTEIETKLLSSAKGRKAAGGLASATESGVVSAYQKVSDAIRNRRVQTGISEEGNPTFTTFKTTFEAIDHVRRKLGDAAFGHDVEGYAGLGQNIAKDLYGKIGKIQEAYAGPVQAELQSGYHAATSELSKYGTAVGRKATAVDRVDPEAFLKDPSSVPKSYFHSQQGVRDLIELTGGDKTTVFKGATSYTAHELEGKSALQVRQWVKENADWMREIPGLSSKAGAYADKLTRIERLGGKLESRAGETARQGAAARPEANTMAEKAMADARVEASARVGSRVEERQNIVKDAATGAEKTKTATIAKAESVVKAGFPAEAVKSLLLRGTPEELKIAARHWAGTPGGKEALVDGVRKVARDMGEKELREFAGSGGRLEGIMREGQLVPAKEVAKLQSDVQRVLRAYAGKAALTKVQMLLNAALATTGGMVAGAVGEKVGGGS